MTIRLSARIAGFAMVAAEATAVATRAHESLVFGTVFVALQIVAIGWATDRRSTVVLRMVAPALLTAAAVAAVWTALALAVPVIATGNTAALVAILAAGLVVAASSRRSAGQRLLPLVLIASAGTALLILLVISCVLPAVSGFISTTHPPIYPMVTRLVDPVGELGIFVLLTLAIALTLCAHGSGCAGLPRESSVWVTSPARTRWSWSAPSRSATSGRQPSGSSRWCVPSTATCPSPSPAATRRVILSLARSLAL